MKRFCVAAILAGLVGASTGCIMMSDFRENMSRTTRMLRPKPIDRPADPMKETDDKGAESGWESQGFEGRKNKAAERDPDRWWWNHVMSSEARDIERHLGFE